MSALQVAETLTDAAMRDILVVLPPPANFAAYADAVRERLIAVLAADPIETGANPHPAAVTAAPTGGRDDR